MSLVRTTLLGALGGAAATLLVLWCWPEVDGAPRSPAPGPDLPASEEPRAGASAPVETRAADPTPIASRLDELAEGLRRLEAKMDALAASQRAPLPEPRPASIDADALMQAMAGVERKKLEALSNEALRQRALQGMKGGDAGAGVQGLEVLLARSLSPEERAKALLDLGMLQRMQGGEAALAASARTLQSVVDTHGIDSKLGIAAAEQLIWTFSDRKEPANGLTHAQAILRSATATRDQRFRARWAAAILVQQLGDVARARAEYEALLRDVDGQAGQEKLTADIRSRLSKL